MALRLTMAFSDNPRVQPLKDGFVPLWEQAGIGAFGPRVEEPAIGLITNGDVGAVRGAET